MLAPLYLLWLLWPSCPLVPPRCRTIKPINPKPGTFWLRRLASLDPMCEPKTPPVSPKDCGVPLHIRHLPRRRIMVGGMPSLAHAHLMAGMSAPIGVDLAAAGQDRTVVVVRGRGDEPSYLNPPKQRAAPKWCFQPAQTAPQCKTPATKQKPWRRPRGLTSAARRRQNVRRKGHK